MRGKQVAANQHPLWNKWRYIQNCVSYIDTRDGQLARRLKLTSDWCNWQSFREDVESHLGLPQTDQLLVRKNTDLGWTLANLEYANYEQKGQHMRNCRTITYKNKQYSIKALAKKLNLNYHTLYCRIAYLGWPVAAAINIPTRRKHHAAPKTKKAKTKKVSP